MYIHPQRTSQSTAWFGLAPLLIVLFGILLAPAPAAAFYQINELGGECAHIGEWNSQSLTCTLTEDLTKPIIVTGPLVTIDGNGHTIDVTEDGADYAVEIRERQSVTVRNVRAVGGGIYANRADDPRIRFNTIEAARIGINLFDLDVAVAEGNVVDGTQGLITFAFSVQDADQLTIRNNRLIEVGDAMNFTRVDGLTLEDNVIETAQSGFDFRSVTNALVRSNTLSEAEVALRLDTDTSDANEFSQNVFRDSNLALEIYADDGPGVPMLSLWWRSVKNWVHNLAIETAWAQVTSGNVFAGNNFQNNAEDVSLVGDAGVMFFTDLPTGGNYWDRFDEVGEGCVDADTDGFCDSVYQVAPGYTDDFPQAAPADIEPPVPQCDDGIDNDDDGLTDYPADPGCSAADDPLEINAPPAPAPTCALAVSPVTITTGASANLSWTSTDADSATIDQGVGEVAATGETGVSPDETTTYTGTFTGPGGDVSCETTLTVESNEPTTVAAPVALAQYKSGGVKSISLGSTAITNTAVFQAELVNLDDRQVQLEVELKEIDEEFDGQDTVLSEPVSSGIAEVQIEELIPKEVHYSSGGNRGRFKWRARTVTEDGGQSQWVNYQPDNEVAFTAKVVPLFTQVQSQFPPRLPEEEWATELYAEGRANVEGDCGLTIADCGCAIASVVMLAHTEDIRTDARGLDVTPFNFDAWLLANNGYTPDGGIIWSSIDRYTNNQLVFTELFNSPGSSNPNNQPSASEFALLDASLEDSDPIPVIARSWWERPRGGIARTHFFVIDSKLGAGEYSVRDPFWYETETLDDPASVPRLVRRYESGFEGLRVFERGDSSLAYTPSLTIILSSPAELLVTDASGRRLGKDPQSGESFAEIPGGYYYEELINNPDPDVPDPANPDPEKILVVPNMSDGEYQLAVIGTGDGSYTLQTTFVDSSGRSNQQAIQDEISVGERHELAGIFDGDFALDSDAGGGGAMVTPEALFDELTLVVENLETQPRLLALRIKVNVVIAEVLFQRGNDRAANALLQNINRLINQRENQGIISEDATVIRNLVDQLLTALKENQYD